jgi:hypothetical protein
MKLERYQLEVVENLNKAGLEAIKTGHHFEGAIINFQRLEVLLRLATTIYATELGINKSALRAINEEQRFHNIVVFFSFVRPKSGLSERLSALNRKRNSFIHKLFIDYKSTESLKRELKSFNLEIVDLIRSLTELLERTMKKMKVVVIGSKGYEIEQLTTEQIEQVFKDLSKILEKTKAVDFSDPFSTARSPIIRAVLKNGRDEAFRWVEMVTEKPAAEIPMKITRPQLKHFLTVFLGMIFHPSEAPAY